MTERRVYRSAYERLVGRINFLVGGLFMLAWYGVGRLVGAPWWLYPVVSVVTSLAGIWQAAKDAAREPDPEARGWQP